MGLISTDLCFVLHFFVLYFLCCIKIIRITAKYYSTICSETFNWNIYAVFSVLYFPCFIFSCYISLGCVFCAAFFVLYFLCCIKIVSITAKDYSVICSETFWSEYIYIYIYIFIPISLYTSICLYPSIFLSHVRLVIFANDPLCLCLCCCRGYVHMQDWEFWKRAILFMLVFLYRVCTHVRLGVLVLSFVFMFVFL